MSTAIQNYEAPQLGLSQWKEPEQVLAEAQKAAVALKRVMESKSNKVMFNGEQYLEREDWGTVGRFYGCTAKSIETRYVEFGDVKGWEAVAVVIDIRTGTEIGRAESMCTTDEENWGDVPYYEWEDILDDQGKKIWDAEKKRYKSRRVQKGSKPKPIFQLRSMAQTRAEAKALKGVFSWVVVLAGFRPTPAEELTGHEDFGDQNPPKQPVQQPQRASEKAKQQPTQQQPAQQTQPAQQNGSKEIAGIIEQSKFAQSGVAWLLIKDEPLSVKVDEKDTDADMKAGAYIKARVVKQHHDALKNEINPQGHFWQLLGLIELTQVQEGEPAQKEAVPHDAPLAPDMQQVADELFGEKKPTGNAVVEGMVQSGELKKASDLPASKSGTIGKKRAQRLYTLINTNKASNFGINEAELKKMLSALPAPLEHLSDLEVGMYEQFEKYCTGAEDWHTFWD